jgi:WD40 repeat protein
MILRSGQVASWAWRSSPTLSVFASTKDEGSVLELRKATISAKGKKIAGESARQGGDVMLFDGDSGKLLGQLAGGRKVTNFTADGSRVGTVDWDGGVSVWDSTTYRRVARLGANQTLAALSPDGHSVFVAQEPAWYIDYCRACGKIDDAQYKKRLREEAWLALQGMTKDALFRQQFTCLARQQ